MLSFPQNQFENDRQVVRKTFTALEIESERTAVGITKVEVRHHPEIDIGQSFRVEECGSKQEVVDCLPRAIVPVAPTAPRPATTRSGWYKEAC